jgi:hypothetical protein
MSWFGLINEETKNVEAVCLPEKIEAILQYQNHQQMIVRPKEEVLVLQP